MQEKIIRDFQESVEVKLAFIQRESARIEQVVRVMAEAFGKGNKVLLFGNGGSSTDASHIAAEFVNRFKIERRGLPAIALACDPAVVTSIANDYSFDRLFARQIETFGAKGDIALGISTSGNSPNVLAGLKAAKELGMVTIGWTGGTGGKMAELVDYPFVVPTKNT
ncbi:MAG: SIS domain-containing protein, partial [Nitrospirota bacterium]|nr:SIS domain-containing protein [Nitrospirota bacterium]